MASGVYNRAKANLMNKEMDWGNGGDAIKVVLLDNNHSFDPDDNKWVDVSVNELATSGTGYEQKTLVNQSVTQDDINNLAKFDADDLQWPAATFTAYHLVIFDDTLIDDDLIGSIDFGGAKSVTGGTFTVQWSVNGVIRLS